MDELTAIRHLTQVYESARTVLSGAHRTTVNEMADQLPATRPSTLLAALVMLYSFGDVVGVNKILTEEDKGALLAGAASLHYQLPVAMARWYTYSIPFPGSTVVPIDMEYAKGRLLVNGIEAHDKFIILDDTLSTGGTAVSLIRAARSLRADVVEMRVVVEKLGMGGREKLAEEGVMVKAALGIRLDDKGHVHVVEALGRPIEEVLLQVPAL